MPSLPLIWLRRLSLAAYVLTLGLAIALTYLDIGNTIISACAMAGTCALYGATIALEILRCYYTHSLPPSDKHYIYPYTKIWYGIKGMGLLGLLSLGLAGIRIRDVHTWELVLIVLTFEGVWYTFLAFDPPRNVLLGLKHALRQVVCLLGMILLLTLPYALLGCILFRDVTPERLAQDGVLGPDSTFSNFVMACLTLWQVAQADNIGALVRAFERIRPGSFIYFLAWNFIMFYLFANALISTFGSDYYASASKDPADRPITARSVQRPRQLVLAAELGEDGPMDV